MKKLITSILSLCTLLGILCGCAPAMEPSDMIEAFYDVYIYNNGSALKELGLEDEDIQELIDLYHDEFISAMDETLIDADVTNYTDQDLEDIYNAQLKAFSGLKASYEQEITEKNKSAVVTVTTTYVDEASMLERVCDEVAQKYDGDYSDLSDEEFDKLLAQYDTDLIAAMIQGYSELKPSEDTTSFTVDCEYDSGVWVPVDAEGFGETLGNAVAGF